MKEQHHAGVSLFDTTTSAGLPVISCIGDGSLGAKADGLHQIMTEVLPRFDATAFPDLEVIVPRAVVISAGCFDAFMDLNKIRSSETEELSDSTIGNLFQASDLPNGLYDDLRAVVSRLKNPLAVRSSSFREAEGDQSFAGINVTKMIPNSEASDEARLKRLIDAVKLVWASTFFQDSVNSRKASGQGVGSERLGVIIQEVFGRHHTTRFYPTLSGIARSYNHYPTAGFRSSEGLVSLAHGLGKSLLDGEASWSYAPARPLAPPPFRSAKDILRHTQTSSWAINTRLPEQPNPNLDTECLTRFGLREAEVDGTLRYLASSYDAGSDRISSGLAPTGARILNFAPLLRSSEWPFNEALIALLEAAKTVTGGEVELEFAAEIDDSPEPKMHLALLQMRPLNPPGKRYPVTCDETESSSIIVGSDSALGNGRRTDLKDIVYLRPEHFAAARTRSIAAELEAVNRGLIEEGSNAVLIGFGRWGSSDERSGIPVRWGQISASRVIVEVSHPEMRTDPSPGETLFHNLLNFQMLYLAVDDEAPDRIDWAWLDEQPALWESHHLRHIRLEHPIEVRVDGTTGCGLIRKPATEGQS